ncbi:MAG: dTDP-4-dehydrorhamnose reductase [Robiginitomaculum sp.]|nr:dTDP-4-dehydrorhamnose reductase [Robiginitomaculum sp.]MDQ7078962.1 dTDP-4-dehydrorhamnose reductase [Robiginitomaculum sp.]
MTQQPSLLVIGRTGQLARALMQAGGDHVTALGRPEVDLTNTDSIKAALAQYRPALVINAAAYTAVDAAERDEAAAQALNTTGPANLAALCAKRDVPLIHISTDYVFDGARDQSYREEDVPSPLGVYGRTKRAGEEAVCQHNPRHIIVRTAWVHSPIGKNFVKTMLHLARDRDDIRVVDDQYGNPTYAPHLAAALLQMATHILGDEDFTGWGIYHLAGTGRTNWADFAKEVFATSAALGGPHASVTPIPSAEYPTPAPRPANSCLQCDKAYKAFGITMANWREGAKTCVQALLAQA